MVLDAGCLEQFEGMTPNYKRKDGEGEKIKKKNCI